MVVQIKCHSKFPPGSEAAERGEEPAYEQVDGETRTTAGSMPGHRGTGISWGRGSMDEGVVAISTNAPERAELGTPEGKQVDGGERGISSDM